MCRNVRASYARLCAVQRLATQIIRCFPTHSPHLTICVARRFRNVILSILLPRNNCDWDDNLFEGFRRALREPLPRQEVESGRCNFGISADTRFPSAGHSRNVSRRTMATSEIGHCPLGFSRMMTHPSSDRCERLTLSLPRTNRVWNSLAADGAVQIHQPFNSMSGSSIGSDRCNAGYSQAQSTNTCEVTDPVRNRRDNDELVHAGSNPAPSPILSVVDVSEGPTQLQDGALRPCPATDDAIPVECVYVGVRAYVGAAVDPLYVCVANECLVLRLRRERKRERRATLGGKKSPTSRLGRSSEPASGTLLSVTTFDRCLSCTLPAVAL
jgi:hypothetical protein